jgi:diamine N-acetyltransferase
MILGDRIRLRSVERDDLSRFVAWFNDPEVRSCLLQILPVSMDDEIRWFESQLERPPAERPFSIDARVKEEWIHIGSCGFMKIDPVSRHAEVGISLGEKKYWNQGYGTETMQQLLEHGFNTLNLHRIFLEVFAFNSRAEAVYRKVGFIEEGRFREHFYHAGGYHDVLIMSILNQEWKSIPGSARPYD